MAESSHPFICELVATHQDTNSLYMVMELVQGGELFHLPTVLVISTTACRAQARFMLHALDDYLHGSGWLYRT